MYIAQLVRNYHFLLKVQQLTLTFRTLTSNMSGIKTFVFVDLETTGLPHLEHNSTRITEFCAVAVQASHIELGCFPRVHNKLSFCVNPNKLISPESTDITGLSNHLLEHQSCFSTEVVDLINKWLYMNQKPICLVAHNGNRFDYPILRTAIEKVGGSFPDDLLCVDSITAFRHIDKGKTVEKPKEEVPFEFDDVFDEILCKASEEYESELQQRITPEEVQKINETTPKKQVISSQTSQISQRGPSFTNKRNFGNVREFVSYKLGDIYTRLTSKQPINIHEAEGDVVMLITCAAVYGEKFVTFANENAVKFGDIPMMKPGKKIGI